MQAREFGALHVVSSRDPSAIKKLAGKLDLILVTANASLDWESLLGALAPNGWLHVVGAVPEPIPISAFSLILAQKSHFPMSRVNEAIERLEAGKARYRIILDADF